MLNEAKIPVGVGFHHFFKQLQPVVERKTAETDFALRL